MAWKCPQCGDITKIGSLNKCLSCGYIISVSEYNSCEVSPEDKINLKAFVYLPFAAIGPIITAYGIWQGKSHDPNALLPAILISFIPIIITAIAAFIVRKVYPHADGITGRTIGLAFIITIVAIVVTSFRNPWFSMIIIFAPLYAAPTLLSFSFFWANLISSEPKTVNNVPTSYVRSKIVRKSWLQKPNGLRIALTFAVIHLCLVLLAYIIKIASSSALADLAFLWFGYLDAPLRFFLPRFLFKTFGSLSPLFLFGIIGSTFWFLFIWIIAGIYTRLFAKSSINKSR